MLFLPRFQLLVLSFEIDFRRVLLARCEEFNGSTMKLYNERKDCNCYLFVLIRKYHLVNQLNVQIDPMNLDDFDENYFYLILMNFFKKKKYSMKFKIRIITVKDLND